MYARVPLRGEGSCGGGGAPRDSTGSGATEEGLTSTPGLLVHHQLPEFTCAAAAKSLQSCPTLCDPIDSSPPGSAIPGILQARVLECTRKFETSHVCGWRRKWQPTLMKVKEESEKVGLKLNIQKTKIMASGPTTLWEPRDGGAWWAAVYGVAQSQT